MTATVGQETQTRGGYGPAAFARAFGVSRETILKLTAYEALLQKWQRRINLVGPNTADQIWARHFADSAQVVEHIRPEDATVVDLGSGAGFPGLVIKILQPGLAVTLIEADTRKAAFLTQAAATLGLKVRIVAKRIDHFAVSDDTARFDVVTARALAPLPALLTLAGPLLKSHSRLILLKGQNVESELISAAKCWTMTVQQFDSLTHDGGRLLRIERLQRVNS